MSISLAGGDKNAKSQEVGNVIISLSPLLRSFDENSSYFK